jgi:large subunit ribosomal protein L6
MSRIGRQPIPIPTGVTVECKPEKKVHVKGPKGELEIQVRPEIDVAVDKGIVNVTAKDAKEDRFVRAWHGMTRALIQNMVVGVTKGYEKKLEIGASAGTPRPREQGRAEHRLQQAGDRRDAAGRPGRHAEPDEHPHLRPDKQAVGDIAASIRKLGRPSPTGAGIRTTARSCSARPEELRRDGQLTTTLNHP